MISRTLIVGRIRPGAQEEVARIFAESDATELPGMVGVRHRSLFVFEGLYVHLIEIEGQSDSAIGNVRAHPLFQDISRKLEPYIEPYNPETWRSPRDAMAREFYSWDSESN